VYEISSISTVTRINTNSTQQGQQVAFSSVDLKTLAAATPSPKAKFNTLPAKLHPRPPPRPRQLHSNQSNSNSSNALHSNSASTNSLRSP
jgi:hypothetical protein